MFGWPWLERGTSETTECDVGNRCLQRHAGSGVSFAALSPTPATRVESFVGRLARFPALGCGTWLSGELPEPSSVGLWESLASVEVSRVQAIEGRMTL